MVNEVFNCNCMEYMRTIPDGFFDLAVADPPYGNPTGEWVRKERFGQRFDRYRDLSGSIDGTFEWDIAPGGEFFDELFRVSKNQVIWGGNYFTLPPTRCFLVWRKLTISESFSMGMAEYAWTSFNDNAKVYEAMPQGKTGDRFHPTQKPIELYSWIYRLFAKPGEKVFDPMMGSQSSRIAAHYADVDFYGCEISEDYFIKGNERFQKIVEGVERRPDGATVIQPTLF